MRSLIIGVLLALVLLPTGAAGLLRLEGRQRRQVDLLLRGSPHQELTGVDQVLPDLDVPLVDQHSRLVDALGLEALLVNTGLQPLVEELAESQPKHVIELELLIGEQPVPMHAVEQGSPLEQTPGVLLLESKQLTSGLPELGEQQLHSPHLTLVLETVLAHQLELVVDTLLLEGTTGGLESARI